MRNTFVVLFLACSLIACEKNPATTATGPAPGVPGLGNSTDTTKVPDKVVTTPQAGLAMPEKPKGPTGEVKGKVALTGTAPVMKPLDRGTDAFCAKTPMKDEEVVVNKNGTLANVIVRVNGLPPAPPTAKDPEINQKDCMYRPRVQGMVAGQTLTIKTSDQTLHTVHTYKGASSVFNVAQVPGSADVKKIFNEAGALIKFQCEVHQWMHGFVWVQNNPYFAVTGDDGTFTIKGIPVGTWDIEAWHERFGTKSGKVTIADGKPAAFDFSYTGQEKGGK